MVPKDSRDSSGVNGNAHPGGKGKAKPQISRTSSNTSLRKLTPAALDTGIDAVRRISKIFCFLQTYDEDISNVEDIYGLSIRQQARIDELDTLVTELTVRKDQEMARLRDQNDAYQAKIQQFEYEREKLAEEQASMEATRKAMQSEMDRRKEKGINKAKQQFSEEANAKVKEMTEELEKKLQALETNNNGLKKEIKTLKEKNIQAQGDLNRQKESLEVDKRSSQSHIMRLESELHHINAASTVSPQAPEF